MKKEAFAVKEIIDPSGKNFIEEKKMIEKIPTGIKNLDLILNGGIPQFSVNLVTGPPGGGKTILTQQMLFNNATPDMKVLYITTLSEPAMKLIRYQQQFDYFDISKLNNSIVYVDIGNVIREKGLTEAINVCIQYVKEENPAIIAIDSFKAIHDLAKSASEVRSFGYDLAVKLSTWECTSFLVGEYTEKEIQEEPIFAIADGIISLTNDIQGMQRVRQIEIRKMRGGACFSGKHPFDISINGIAVYPRITTPSMPPAYNIAERKIPIGVSELDEMFQGGIPEGTSTLVAGGAGSGKTLLGLHFIIKGVEQGEPGVIVNFQETPSQLYAITKGFGWDLKKMEKEKKLKILYSSPVEMNVDQHTSLIKDTAKEIGAKRIVIDSLMDIEIATPDKVRYKDYIYSLVNFFKSEGITSMMTNEIPELFGSLKLTSYGISFISDIVILLRYIEIESTITRGLSILKMRGSNHDKDIREFEIDSSGVTILKKFEGQEGILSGRPTRAAASFDELLKKMGR